MKKSTKENINNLIVFLLMFIISYSIVGMTSLLMTCFFPTTSAIIALLFSVVSTKYLSDKLFLTYQKNIYYGLLLTLIFAFSLRSAPYKMLHGGQDQGLYVNMSAHFERGEEIYFNDDIIPEIENKELKQIYQKNIGSKDFLPGIYRAKEAEEDYVFQFYHLHPVWMSLFGSLFGDEARYFSLTFFSLLSIAGLFLLCFELTRSTLITYLFGFIISISPLHVFFSKWQVTEIVALCFSAVGLWLLLHAINRAKKENQGNYLIIQSGIAAAFFSLYYFTRISGFIFLPFIVFCLLSAFWDYKRKNTLSSKILAIFAGCSLLLFILSVPYGLEYTPNYSVAVYNNTFKRVGAFIIPGLILLAIAFWVVRYFANREQDKKLYKTLNILMVLAIMIMPIIGLITKGDVWHLNTLEDIFIKRVDSVSFFNWLLHTGIIGSLIILPMLWKKIDDKRVFYSIVFLMAPAFFIFALKPGIRYQHYYSRYMISELIPYSLLFIYFILSFAHRKLVIGFTVFAGIIFMLLTSRQFGVVEGSVAYEIMTDIDSEINEKDILLFNKTGWKLHQSPIRTPLSIYFNIKTFPVHRAQIDDVSQKLINEIDAGIFLLSPTRVKSENYEMIDSYIHYDRVTERTPHIPLKITENYWYQPLYLYKYVGIVPIIPARTGFYSDNLWTKGDATIKYLNPVKEVKVINVNTKGYHPYPMDTTKLNMKLLVNGVETKMINFNKRSYQFAIPNYIKAVTEIQIKTNTFIPKELGMNNDSRVLGLDIDKIEFN